MAGEEVRLRLRRKLEEMVGVDEADLLMDRPPGGWGDLVTKDWLHLELSVIVSKIDGQDAKFVGKLEAHDARFDAIDGRLDKLDGRLDKLDGRLDKLEIRMTSFEREFRAQTWRLVGTMTGLVAALAVVIKL